MSFDNVNFSKGGFLAVKRSFYYIQDRILGEVAEGSPPPPSEMTCGFLIELVFCKKKTMWSIGVEVQQETSAPPPKKNPGSVPDS